MQHSPQEIKTKLGEAVDPEGNVLNMAAVVEVIGLLERTPLTREALEHTRIGRTVNLLRKKTNNEDIARRAKRLVKKWQKLVQNHLEAVRNTNSPLNGVRCNSPVVNGLVKNEEQANSPAEPLVKPEHKLKGTKRKRLSVDSPVTEEIPEIQENAELANKNNTSCKTKNDNNTLQRRSSTSNQSSFDSEENLTQGISSNECSQELATNLLKRIKTEDSESVCNQESTQVQGDTLTSAENISCTTEAAPAVKTNNSDHTDVRWEGKDVAIQTDDLLEQDNQNRAQITSELLLDVEHQANGVNGRFGEDGTWCSWSETMPCNEGSLIILPYVNLE